jgi:hypothetical protein
MKTADLISLLKSKGFSHDRYPRKTWREKYGYKHYLMKGDCRIKIEGSMVVVEFIQSKSLLTLEGNMIGPFRDGVMFDVNSREMVR